jgi:mannitol-1-phosphate/altronate dehydrogenase
MIHSWKTEDAATKVNCLCLGTGRFLRSVLVPVLNHVGLHPALIQPRGTTFMGYMQEQSATSYEVDTVTYSGEIVTDRVACYGAFSLGNPEGRAATLDFVKSLEHEVQIIGVGITEAGLASADTQGMKDLMELLRFLKNQSNTICIIDMDNVPNNGDLIQSHLVTLADEEMLDFIQNQVVCLNTMVDRITSARPGSDVPRAEPLPAKALVVLDENSNLPPSFGIAKGVVVRSTAQQLEADISLKLRVANGTHTAVAHAMALQKMLLTDQLGTDENRELWMDSYLESLVHDQILAASPYGKEESHACWLDWKGRLAHPHFGLSSFFITQNGAAKAGIRWSGTIVNLVSDKKPITVAMALAYAALIRWLTPQQKCVKDGIFVGWLDGAAKPSTVEEGVVYADGLRYNLETGWYEFKCACEIRGKSFSEYLMALSGKQPASYYGIIKEYLLAPAGGDLGSLTDAMELDILVRAIATLVARMAAGDSLEGIMKEMLSKQGVYTHGFSTDCRLLIDGTSNTTVRTLHYQTSPVPNESRLMKTVVDATTIGSVLFSEVASAETIDLHTHLLPPTHGPLCSWGIDELLTYVSIV